ncbi:MAG TPA: AI-2E family transporter [Actinomycetota bacterium]
MGEEPNARQARSWWKWLLAALGALIAAAIAWGSIEPEPEGPVGADMDVPALPPVSEEAAARVERTPPPWVRSTILWTIGIVVAVAVTFLLLGVMQDVVVWLVLALFFSFALEPAVNYMQARWGWRRGVTTILLIAFVLVALVLIGLIFLSAVVQGLVAIASRLPEWAKAASEWASANLGVEIDTSGVAGASEDTVSRLLEAGSSAVEVLFGISTSLIVGLFGFFTVAMFVFYMVAEASQFKRAVLSFFSRQRQDELISIWEAAIEKTGGYFYSRLLVAVINGTLTYVVFRLLGVPGAAALALFQGAVAAFIPIVGTYVASAVPAVVIFMSLGATETVIYLVWVLIYQQIENLLIYPRVQGKTMQIHPAVAFGAALAGGALGGLMWAFLALPFAATVQASASLWIQRHDVEESVFVADVTRAPRHGEEGAATSPGRIRGAIRRSRGWLRRRESEPESVEDVADARSPDTGDVGDTRTGQPEVEGPTGIAGNEIRD